jgi:hypothetical protein
MKATKLFFAISILGIVLTSCKTEPSDNTKVTLVDFEDVILNSNGISSDSTNSKFVSGNSTFLVNTGGFWNGGIICSSDKDTVTSGYINEYSAITGSGAMEGLVRSNQYGVVYTPGTFNCPADKNGYFSIQSIMLTNSTYAYRDMLNGSPYSKKFAAGDWFKVIITGYKMNIVTSKTEFYLADFQNGKSFLLNSWTKVDLSALGQVDKVTFTFDSSDKGQYGINTPQYVCIDNISFKQTYSLPL